MIFIALIKSYKFSLNNFSWKVNIKLDSCCDVMKTTILALQLNSSATIEKFMQLKN